jgi:hypothetical protein
LARLKVDVVVTGGNAALAAKQASSAVPIVFAALPAIALSNFLSPAVA